MYKTGTSRSRATWQGGNKKPVVCGGDEAGVLLWEQVPQWHPWGQGSERRGGGGGGSCWNVLGFGCELVRVEINGKTESG